MDGLQGVTELVRAMERMAARARNSRRPLREAGTAIRDEIRHNFNVGGPGWEPHAESTRKQLTGPRRILIRSGRLLNSFRPRVESGSVEVGTDVIYAKRQHFGYVGGPGVGHSPTPARPFWREFDTSVIGTLFFNHVTG